MKLGEEVDTNNLVKLGGNHATATSEYSEFSRWKVRPAASDLFGTGYVITGKKKSTKKEYLLGHSDDHDTCMTQMKKFVKTEYKSDDIQHVL